MGNNKSFIKTDNIGLCVIEIIQINNLPNMDIGSLTDAYTILSFRSSTNLKLKLNGIEIKSEPKNNNLNPIFHSFYEFPFIPEDNDHLSIKILDYDLTSQDDKIGKASIPFLRLKDFQTTTIPLNMDTGSKKLNASQTTVTLRLVYCGPLPTTEIRKEIFLIRHGESKWNISQSEKDIKGMVTQYDHELTPVGIAQAISFNQKWKAASNSSDTNELEDSNVFTSAEAIFASPLTRATQTALLTCESHPAFQNNDPGLTLLSGLREAKNFGSFDTVGEYSGDGIKDHIKDLFNRDLGEESCLRLLEPSIDPHDAVEQWWTALEVKESKSDVIKRMDNVWAFLRYGTTANTIILVGHSHYFRQMMQEYLSDEYRQRDPEWTTLLDRSKLDNASAVRMTVVWNYNVDNITQNQQNDAENNNNEKREFKLTPVIDNVKLIFGSKLVGDDPTPGESSST